jgi:hypothetical protein
MVGFKGKGTADSYSGCAEGLLWSRRRVALRSYGQVPPKDNNWQVNDFGLVIRIMKLKRKSFEFRIPSFGSLIHTQFWIPKDLAGWPCQESTYWPMLHVNIDLSESLQDCVEWNIYQRAAIGHAVVDSESGSDTSADSWGTERHCWQFGLLQQLASSSSSSLYCTEVGVEPLSLNKQYWLII